MTRPGTRPPSTFPIGWLLVALLAGLLLGAGFALVSVLMPGVLPVLGLP